MDDMACDPARPFRLVYRNPRQDPDRARFVGGFLTAEGAERARADHQARADAEGRPAVYAVITGGAT